MYTIEVVSIDQRIVNTKNGPKPVFEVVSVDGEKYKFGFYNPSRVGVVVGSKFTANGTTDKWGVTLDPKTVTIGGGGSVTPIASSGPQDSR
jgi:hypothetical protein